MLMSILYYCILLRTLILQINLVNIFLEKNLVHHFCRCIHVQIIKDKVAKKAGFIKKFKKSSVSAL